MKRQRGAALILVLIMTVVFLILMGTMIDVLAWEAQDARQSARSEAALTAAYSGVDELILNIEEFYTNGIHNGQFPTGAACAFQSPTGQRPNSGCDAVVKSQWFGTGLNYYLIESTGWTDVDATSLQPNRVSRVVDALVRQIPFGAYARFTENERSNTGGLVWYSSGQSYGGPVYSGGPMYVRYDSGKPTPIFPEGFTTSQPPHWYDIVDQIGGPPDSQAEREAVFGSNGSGNVESTSQQLPGLAQNLVVFSEAFYGDDQHGTPSDPALSSSPGVYVNGQIPSSSGQPLTTGVYIQGDVQLAGQSVAGTNGGLSDGSETFIFTGLGPGDKNSFTGTVTVKVDFAAGTTSVTNSGGTFTYTGVASGEATDTNHGVGAYFVNGSVTIADGTTIHGQYTIATPDPPLDKGQDITLTGSVRYASDPQSGPSQDELGLWSNDIWLNTGDTNPRVDGMLLTGYANECAAGKCADGFFANADCNAATCWGGTGDATFFGSLVQNISGKMGAVGSGEQLVGGFFRHDVYDGRLGANPPPFSPTTNLYSIVAVQNHDAL